MSMADKSIEPICDCVIQVDPTELAKLGQRDDVGIASAAHKAGREGWYFAIGIGIVLFHRRYDVTAAEWAI